MTNKDSNGIATVVVNAAIVAALEEGIHSGALSLARVDYDEFGNECRREITLADIRAEVVLPGEGLGCLGGSAHDWTDFSTPLDRCFRCLKCGAELRPAAHEGDPRDA